MGEDNKAVVRHCFQTGADGDLDALAAIIGSDYVLHDPASGPRPPAAGRFRDPRMCSCASGVTPAGAG